MIGRLNRGGLPRRAILPRGRAFLLVAGLSVLFGTGLVSVQPSASDRFQIGDLFIGGHTFSNFIPFGIILWKRGASESRDIYRAWGNEVEGLAFCTDGKLWVASTNAILVFNQEGEPDHGFLSDFFPRGIVFDASGQFYVPSGGIIRYDSSGDLKQIYHIPAPGAFQIDLAADQCTMFYSSFSGDRTIRRYDVCRDEALADFATLPTQAFTARLLADGRVLVPAEDSIYLLGGDATVIATYDSPDVSIWSSAVAFTPDLSSFWAVGVTRIQNVETRLLYRFSLDQATPVDGPYDTTDLIRSLAVFGEPRAAAGPSAPADPAAIPLFSRAGLFLLGLAIAAVGMRFVR